MNRQPPQTSMEQDSMACTIHRINEVLATLEALEVSSVSSTEEDDPCKHPTIPTVSKQEESSDAKSPDDGGYYNLLGISAADIFYAQMNGESLQLRLKKEDTIKTPASSPRKKNRKRHSISDKETLCRRRLSKIEAEQERMIMEAGHCSFATLSVPFSVEDLSSKHSDSDEEDPSGKKSVQRRPSKIEEEDEERMMMESGYCSFATLSVPFLEEDLSSGHNDDEDDPARPLRQSDLRSRSFYEPQRSRTRNVPSRAFSMSELLEI